MNIVTLSNDACTLLSSIEKLQQNKRQAADIEATYKKLQDVKEAAHKVRNLYQLLCKRSPIQDLQQTELPKVLKEIEQLQTTFVEGQQRRQVQDLNGIQSLLSRIEAKILQEWGKYADKCLSPYLELYKTMRLLPELREHEARVLGLQNSLQHYRSLIPQNQRELADFDRCFEQYKKHFFSLEQLHPDIRNFLNKVYNHTATMTDVTDEVLRWCRQGEHAKVFRIDFTM